MWYDFAKIIQNAVCQRRLDYGCFASTRTEKCVTLKTFWKTLESFCQKFYLNEKADINETKVI